MDLGLLAMVFEPFETTHKSYVDVESLLAEYSMEITHKLVMKGTGLDEIHVYMGNNMVTELLNFKGFVAYNRLYTFNHATLVWGYDRIIAVRYNALSRFHVDIPASMFPWPRAIFSYEDNAEVLVAPLTIDQPVLHTLASKCKVCAKRKKACIPLPGMQCSDCKPGQCEVSPTEDNARIRTFFNVLAESAFALCPPYQHLIQSVKVAIHYSNGDPKMPCRDRAILNDLVHRRYIGWEEKSTNLVVACAESWQQVRFQNGKLYIDMERNMGGVYGFRCHDEKRASKLRCATVIPHFGLATPQLAYSFMDSVLASPGKIYWIEASVMYRDGFRTARIAMVASIYSEDHMAFVVGWRFK
jgi:hypothetical protein